MVFQKPGDRLDNHVHIHPEYSHQSQNPKKPPHNRERQIMSKLLWSPSPERIQSSNMIRFMRWINKRFSLSLKDYPELYQWSVEHIADFWGAWWEYTGMIMFPAL
jgi:hypothetical protein